MCHHIPPFMLEQENNELGNQVRALKRRMTNARLMLEAMKVHGRSDSLDDAIHMLRDDATVPPPNGIGFAK